MPRLYLVRHARPSAGWGTDPDPGLDSLGIEQARSTAADLAATLPPTPILSSPLRRCRETAQPLEQLWQQRARTCAPVAEIPAPPLEAAARRDWLSKAMQGSWRDMQQSSPPGSPDYHAWRQALTQFLVAIEGDTVIYSHFIAINAAVAAARQSDRVVCFRPDHASVTVIETSSQGIQLISLGREAATGVLTR